MPGAGLANRVMITVFALLAAMPGQLAAQTTSEGNKENPMPDIIALTRSWLEVFPEGNFEDFPGEVADDFLLRLPFMPPGATTDYRGREYAQGVLQRSAESRSKLAFTDIRILRTEDPELVLTTARGSATMNNGNTYSNEYIMLTRIRGDVVLEHIEYLNPIAVIESMREE